MRGQADDLGGGVFKKRLHKNQYRNIILAKGRRFWVYAYLFAKSARANIDQAELQAFRELAELYAHKSDTQVDKELASHALLEICHAHEAQVQKRRL